MSLFLTVTFQPSTLKLVKLFKNVSDLQINESLEETPFPMRGHGKPRWREICFHHSGLPRFEVVFIISNLQWKQKTLRYREKKE